MFKRFDWHEFTGFVDEKIKEAGGLDVPGPDKFGHVKAAAQKWLDDNIEPESAILETLSDGAIKVGLNVIESFLQSRYQRAKEKGLIR